MIPRKARPPKKRDRPRIKRDRAPRPDAAEFLMIYPDGREVCDTARPQGLELYRSRKGTMFARQGGRCAICGDRNLRLHEPEFDHRTGRGMGAAKRDDRIWTPEGQPMNALVCHSCNSAKGSQVFEYPFQTKITRQEYESSMLGQIEGL